MAPYVDTQGIINNTAELYREESDSYFKDVTLPFSNQLRVIWSPEEVLVKDPKSEIMVDPYNSNKGRLTCFLSEWMFKDKLVYCTCAREIKANMAFFSSNRNNAFIIPEGWELDESQVQHYDRHFSPSRVRRQLAHGSQPSSSHRNFSLFFFCFRDLPIKRVSSLPEGLRASL